MPEPVLIEPDVNFVKSVLWSGGSDLKKCYQCATCSVVCTLSPDDSPFPRKQMVEAQWGLKDRLLGDPAIWLCHNCGDCSTKCPRGARPGDVFGALRNQAIQHLAWPRSLGKLVASPAALPLLLLLPVAAFGAMALWAPKEPAEQLEFANLFPIPILEILFFAIAGLVSLAFGVGLFRFVKGLRAAGATGSILGNFVPALLEILTHARFRKCGKEKGRFWGHLLMLWGFGGLAFMGTVVGIGSMTGLMHTPLPFWDPAKPVESVLKVFANVCAAVILVGGVILLVDRLLDPVKRAASTYFDWFFLLVLEGVIFTGILSQGLRLVESASVMFAVYFVHLVLIFTLFLYAPYTKFAHLLYRTVAMAATRKG
jgi:quinone-modifying oxidoreductase subunit QmoC